MLVLLFQLITVNESSQFTIRREQYSLWTLMGYAKPPHYFGNQKELVSMKGKLFSSYCKENQFNENSFKMINGCIVTILKQNLQHFSDNCDLSKVFIDAAHII